MSFNLLPPVHTACPKCAVEHGEEEPHNFLSLYWGFWFQATYGRSPVIADAFAHCPSEVRQKWSDGLRSMNFGDIADQIDSVQ